MSTPLLIRPGTRYECHGDGTCCTLIHQLGPLTQAESSRVRAAAKQLLPERKQPATSWHDGIQGFVIETDQDRCLFLDRRARCLLHARVGAAAKPTTCRQFPLGTTSTAAGVRVTLSHRCACVSIGRSPLLDEKRARSILASPQSGRILPDVRVEGRIRWRAKRGMSMEAYAAWEKPLLARLDGEEEPLESILHLAAADRLPKLQGISWKDVARHLAHDVHGSNADPGLSAIVRWVELVLQGTSGCLPRPWAWTFERAAAREKQRGNLRRIYGGWLADELWALAWALDRSAYRAVADMAARYVIARRLAERLEGLGVRGDVAAAEGIMMADVLGVCRPWGWVVQQMVEPEHGAFECSGA